MLMVFIPGILQVPPHTTHLQLMHLESHYLLYNKISISYSISLLSVSVALSVACSIEDFSLGVLRLVAEFDHPYAEFVYPCAAAGHSTAEFVYPSAGAGNSSAGVGYP